MCNQRNIIPPTLQQEHKRSGDIPNNSNSQNTENSAGLRRYSVVEKQPLNLENNNKG